MKKLLIPLCAAVTTLAACSSQHDANEKNFSTAIDSFIQKRTPAVCFSYLNVGTVISDNDPDPLAKELRALASVGVLAAATTRQYGSTATMHQYSLTSLGKSHFQDGQICFGKVSLDKVVGWTPVEKVPGMDAATTAVSFTYSVQDVPSWANSADVRDAIPYVRDVLAGSEKHQAVIADLTLMGDHWSVGKIRSPL
ncbi:hypothetical protein [Paraburkholderia tropica]|uniref:hypothetical protein n=1 Tax=Paraburkholderia tropica TaxID=92647 RepID=UPI002AB743FD|nr:hypothetical protein [Paraburkholderia tropica]